MACAKYIYRYRGQREGTPLAQDSERRLGWSKEGTEEDSGARAALRCVQVTEGLPEARLSGSAQEQHGQCERDSHPMKICWDVHMSRVSLKTPVTQISVQGCRVSTHGHKTASARRRGVRLGLMVASVWMKRAVAHARHVNAQRGLRT